MRFLSALALCALAIPAASQPLTWEPLGGPYDGSVYDLHALPIGEAFALSGRVLYRSTDEGLTWTAVETPTAVSDLEPDSDDLVVAGPGGVFRSGNGGTTWTSLGLEAEGAAQVAVGPGGLLLAFSGEDVYHSTDDGATWDAAEGEVTTGVPRCAVITPEGVMVVARLYYSEIPSTIIYRSMDGGQTWTTASHGFIAANFALGTGEEIFAVGTEYSSFDFYVPPGFYRSADGGATWTRLRNGSASGGGRFADGRLWVGTANGLLLSDNEGASWSSPIMETAAPPSALLLPGGAVLAGSGSYCHASWEPPVACVRSGGLYRLGPEDDMPRQVGLRAGAASVLAWEPDGSLLVATSSNLLRWSEADEAWEPLRWRGGPIEDVVTLGEEVLVSSPDIYGVVRLSDGALLLEAEGCFEYDCSARALARDAGGTLFVSATAFVYGDGAGVFRSVDEGETWEVSLPEINNVEVFAVGPNGTLYAGTGGEPTYVGVPGEGVYRSTDDGETWEQLAGGLSGGVSALAVGPTGEALAGAEEGGVLRLNGEVWEPIGLDERITAALVVTDREYEVAGTDAGVFLYDGEEWVSGGLSHPTTALLLAADGTGYAATDQGVFRSIGPVIVDAEGTPAPTAEVALSVYPNPAASATTVTLVLGEAEPVEVVAYDVLGRRVAVLHEGPLSGGVHRLAFDPAGLPSGTYLVRAEGERVFLTRRVTLIR